MSIPFYRLARRCGSADSHRDMPVTEGRLIMSGDFVEASAARTLADRAFGAKAGTVVYVDRAPRGPGVVSFGTEEVRLDRPALLVFRDEAPGANWMHPCAYALVDLETGGVVKSASSDRPPQFGFLPNTWVVASDPDRRADLVSPEHHEEGV